MAGADRIPDDQWRLDDEPSERAEHEPRLVPLTDGDRRQPEPRTADASGLRRHGGASWMVPDRRLCARHARDRSGSASSKRGGCARCACGARDGDAWPRRARVGRRSSRLVGRDTPGLDLRGGRRDGRHLANCRDAMRSADGRERICDAPVHRARGSACLCRVDRDFAERDLFFARRFDGNRVGCVHDDRDRNRPEHAPATGPGARGGIGRRDRAVALGGSDWLRDRSGDGRIADSRRRGRRCADRSSALAPARMVGAAPRGRDRLRDRRRPACGSC